MTSMLMCKAHMHWLMGLSRVSLQVLATLAVDDRVRIHSRWSLSSILQLYMLGLWPLVVAGVRPLSSLLSLASAA